MGHPASRPAGGRPQPFGLSAPNAASALHAKDDVNYALHPAEPRRVERVGDLDHSIVRPVDLKGEPCGSEFNEAEAEVAGVLVGVVCLDVADAAVVVLELALNEQVGLEGRR
jgi:hypothetical protein